MKLKVKLVMSLLLMCPMVKVAAQVERRDTLESSLISAKKVRNSTQIGLVSLDSTMINRGFAFLSTPDIIKTLQSLPGVSGGSELMSGLFVHGGEGYDNLYTLDGVPIYQISHLAGFFSSFNTDIIENVDFYKAGFPARYGGRLSSVVDISTIDGSMNKTHGTFSIGLIDGRAQIGGPIIENVLSYNISARRTYAEPIMMPIVALTGPKDHPNHGRYAFYDLSGKLTWKMNRNAILRFNLYNGRDALDYGTWSAFSELLNTEISAAWGNTLASVQCDWKIRPSLLANIRAYSTTYRSKFSLDETTYRYQDTLIVSNRAAGIAHDLGLAADFLSDRFTRHTIRFGAEAIRHAYVADIHTFEGSAYIEDEMSLTPWLKANAGVRGVLMSQSDRLIPKLEPRFSLMTFPMANLKLKLAYSQMNQASHRVATSYLDLPADFWMPSTDKMPILSSQQFSFGTYSSLPHDIMLDIEGWYKTMEGLTEYYDSYSYFPPLEDWESSFIPGRGRSWGLEAHLKWKGEKTEAEAAYTLSWSQRYFPEIWPEWFRDRNDNRHRLNLGLIHRFSERFNMYAAWIYHSGNRCTVPTNVAWEVGDVWEYPQPYYGEPYNFKFPDYHRLDIGLNWIRRTESGAEKIWNLSLYNAYCRINAMQVSVEWDQNGKAYAVAGGALPIIPSFSWTYRF